MGLLVTFSRCAKKLLAEAAGQCNSIAATMNVANSWFDMRRGGMRRFWAVACLVLFVGLQFAAVSEQLHKAIHADAQHADHTCVIKLLSLGQVEAADSAILVPPPSLALVFESIPEPITLSPADYLLQFGRAPPSIRA